MRRWHFIALLALTSVGCNRHDVDGLGRIGRKVFERTQVAVSPLREKLDHTVKGIGATAGIKERVQQRLQYDKALADTRVEVGIVEGEVELRGTLKTDAQKRRAVELAETTMGVDRVADRLQVE